jgi:hypothetical protein
LSARILLDQPIGDKRMSRSAWIRCFFYLLIAAAAFYGTWSENAQIAGSDMLKLFANFGAELKVNPASRSIGIDIFLFGLAGSTLMIVEARRLGIRFVYLYILLGYFIAISVAFPFFLISREQRLAHAGPGEAETKLTILDYAGIAALTALTAWLCVYLKA